MLCNSRRKQSIANKPMYLYNYVSVTVKIEPKLEAYKDKYCMAVNVQITATANASQRIDNNLKKAQSDIIYLKTFSTITPISFFIHIYSNLNVIVDKLLTFFLYNNNTTHEPRSFCVHFISRWRLSFL